ncbi:hypothetical protein PG994_009924 [Apiospora phragmitis]|uniref:Uncharacterized protein n=1 Tax=Apiospora phragmitis TaxID=2905665 RepID=A0ABR1TNE5_9PEZI
MFQINPHCRQSDLSDGASLVSLMLFIYSHERNQQNTYGPNPRSETITSSIHADVLTACRNPTLEDQALARVHRLGQTKEGFIRRVMELQESKRSLAGGLLSPHDGGQTDDSNQSELQPLHIGAKRS